MDAGAKFDEEYFMRGVESGRSNYTDYRWLPELTIPMAIMAQRVVGITSEDEVCDVGCGRGYFVKALRMLGVHAWGQDISRWAIENCDPDVRDWATNSNILSRLRYDHVWSKDCLEHVHMDQLIPLIASMLGAARKSVFVIVPLSATIGGEYLNPLDEKDETHINRLPLKEWMSLIQSTDPSFAVFGSYRVPMLKASSEHYPGSAGFIHARRY